MKYDSDTDSASEAEEVDADNVRLDLPPVAYRLPRVSGECIYSGAWDGSLSCFAHYVLHNRYMYI